MPKQQALTAKVALTHGKRREPWSCPHLSTHLIPHLPWAALRFRRVLNVHTPVGTRRLGSTAPPGLREQWLQAGRRRRQRRRDQAAGSAHKRQNLHLPAIFRCDGAAEQRKQPRAGRLGAALAAWCTTACAVQPNAQSSAAGNHGPPVRDATQTMPQHRTPSSLQRLGSRESLISRLRPPAQLS